jgi:Icc-related predicted phosphoesterase
MRIAVMSDLHLEQGEWVAPALDVDVVVLAGDIDHGVAGVDWAARSFAGRPVLYLSGNHENWEHDAADIRSGLAAAAARTDNVRFLDNTELWLDQTTRVLGCTLWVDYCVHGAELQATRMAELTETAKDFRNFTYRGASLTPQDVLSWHRQSRAWLEERLRASSPGITTIVATHHAPSLMSLSPHRRERPIIAGAASNLEQLILETAPALWIHGHTHDDADYTLGATRIVSRQRGTPGNTGYAPLVIELS